MTDVRVCLFDFDGTLCDTRAAVLSCLTQTLTEAGVSPVDPAQIDAPIARGATLHDTFRALVPEGSDERIEALVMAYREVYNASGHLHSRLFPGAKATLHWLRDRGIACVIVSNKGLVAIQNTLRLHRLDDQFQQVLADAGGLPNKPAPASFERHIRPRYSEVPLDNFLMIGDTKADIEYARRCGIDACWARYGYGRPRDGNGARYVLAVLDELRNVVAGRNTSQPLRDEGTE